MSAEPPLAHAALLRVLSFDYGLELDTVTFLPGGTAPAYLEQYVLPSVSGTEEELARLLAALGAGEKG